MSICIGSSRLSVELLSEASYVVKDQHGKVQIFRWQSHPPFARGYMNSERVERREDGAEDGWRGGEGDFGLIFDFCP